MRRPDRSLRVFPRHPVVDAERRALVADPHLRLADHITRFAGSMTFVYLHAGLFAVWMVLLEATPWPTLTLVVSLEAIFLSTFVMLGQNRQAAFQQAKADHDFRESELELKTNTELTRQIHVLTTALHHHLVVSVPGPPCVALPLRTTPERCSDQVETS